VVPTRAGLSGLHTVPHVIAAACCGSHGSHTLGAARNQPPQQAHRMKILSQLKLNHWQLEVSRRLGPLMYDKILKSFA